MPDECGRMDLSGARREGRGWRRRCPFHGGHRRVVGDGREGRLLVKCWGGGRSVHEILAELSRQGLVGDERPGDNAGHMVDDRGNGRHDGARLVEIGRIRSTQLHRNQIQSRSCTDYETSAGGTPRLRR